MKRCFRATDAAHPVHGALGAEFNGAEFVAGGNVGRAQQRNLQAGDVDGVAAGLFQCGLGVLDGAPGGLPVHGVAHPVVDGHGVVAQFCGFGADGGGEGDFWGFGEVGGGGGLAGLGRNVEAQGADAGAARLGEVDVLVFVQLLVPGTAGLGGGALAGLGGAPGQALGVQCGGGLGSRVALEEVLQSVEGGLGLAGLAAPLLGDATDFLGALAQFGLGLVVALQQDGGKAALDEVLALLFEVGEYGLGVGVDGVEQVADLGAFLGLEAGFQVTGGGGGLAWRWSAARAGCTRHKLLGATVNAAQELVHLA